MEFLHPLSNSNSILKLTQAGGGNLTTTAYVKDHVPRISFLETSRIIALPPPKSNRKPFLVLHTLTPAHVTRAKHLGGKLLLAYAKASQLEVQNVPSVGERNVRYR